MRYLEVRRHAMRTRPGQHLSQAGVELAHRVGRALPPFNLVIASTALRAVETAEAMGLRVDEKIEQLSTLDPGVEAEVAWDAGFAAFAQAMRRGGATARFGIMQAALWRSIALRLPDGGRALILTHGGIIEAGAVACLPQADHAAWGPACGYLEGVRLAFNGENFVDAEILRVAQPG